MQWRSFTFISWRRIYCNRKQPCLITARRIAVPVEQVLLSAPEILFCFVKPRLLFMLLHRGQTFPLLVSHAGCSGAFTTGHGSEACNQRDELKRVHTLRYSIL